jgi:hypothetical protein
MMADQGLMTNPTLPKSARAKTLDHRSSGHTQNNTITNQLDADQT